MNGFQTKEIPWYFSGVNRFILKLFYIPLSGSQKATLNMLNFTFIFRNLLIKTAFGKQVILDCHLVVDNVPTLFWGPLNIRLVSWDMMHWKFFFTL